MKNRKNIWLALGGLAVGLVNGIFGAGGGMLAVPLLKKAGGLPCRKAHINAIAVVLPITVVSAAFYLIGGKVELSDAYIYIPAGLAGALAGTFIIKKIPEKWLRRAFALFMIWAGYRMITR